MTPVKISQYAGGASTYSITTTADAPAGGSIIMIFGGAGPPQFGGGNSVTDSAGNTYVLSSTVDGTGWYSYAICANNLHLPLGGTINVSVPGGATHEFALALYVDAIMSIDIFGPGANFTNNSPQYTTTPPSTFPELAVGLVLDYPGGGTTPPWTEPAGWTDAFNSFVSGTGSLYAMMGYKVTVDVNPINYAPIINGVFHSNVYINVFTFKPYVAPSAGGRAMVTWF